MSRLLIVVGLMLFGSITFAAKVEALSEPGTTEEFPIPAESSTSRLGAIVRGAEGSMWFVEYGQTSVPTGQTSKANTIVRVSPTGLVTGEFVVPTDNIPDNDHIYVKGLALGKNGEVWFTSHGEFNGDQTFIGFVTPAGRISQFTIPGSQTEGYYPEAITLGSDGNMWFADNESRLPGAAGPISGSIGKITPSGTISKFAIPDNAIVNAVALGSDGDIWFVASERNELSYVGRITPSGTTTTFTIPASDDSAYGIALGADGNMWFTNPGVGKVGRITPEGSISEFIVPGAGGAIVLGPDGNMWFTEGYGADAIGRITPSGEVNSFAPISAHGEFEDLASGPEGTIWFTDGTAALEAGTYIAHVGRFIIPFAPVNDGLPVVSGAPVQGQLLSASTGSWANNPTSFVYQWQVCDGSGGGCSNMGGEVAATHVLTAVDIGHRLRVAVRASNAGGSTLVASEPSGIVQPMPPPVILAAITEPLPIVGAAMTWSFRWSGKHLIVASLMVHGLPVGGAVEVACTGPGCGFSHRRWATTASNHACAERRCASRPPAILRGSVNLAAQFKGWRLRVGSHISVNITKTGWIGKSFVFDATHIGKSPRVHTVCLAPISNKALSQC